MVFVMVESNQWVGNIPRIGLALQTLAYAVKKSTIIQTVTILA